MGILEPIEDESPILSTMESLSTMLADDVSLGLVLSRNFSFSLKNFLRLYSEPNLTWSSK